LIPAFDSSLCFLPLIPVLKGIRNLAGSRRKTNF
jgi:hypothetical protein